MDGHQINAAAAAELDSLELVEAPASPDPAVDQALSNALLDEVSAGRRGPVLRLVSPASMVSFGSEDRQQAELGAGAAAALARGHAPVNRPSGGRAVVFGPHTVLFAFVLPRAVPLTPNRRFDTVAGLLCEALAAVGCPAEIGETAGEYCPGAHSLRAGGRKVSGMAQRITPRAALVEGVIVVEDADSTRATLLDVYHAIGYSWDPATAGALDQVAPGVGVDAVRAAIADSLTVGRVAAGADAEAAAARIAADLRVAAPES
jgi:lipoate-protein ligase A